MRRIFLLPVLVVALGGAAVQPADAKRGTITPEALLASGLQWQTVKAVAGATYWPQPPAFNSIVDQEDPQPITAVGQSFVQIGGTGKITGQIFAFRNADVSLQYLQTQAIVGDDIDQVKPAVGDQHFYYVTTLSGGRSATRFVFIHGAIGAEIEVTGKVWSRERIAQLATPIDEAIGKLLAGTLPVPPVPPAQAALLPPASAAPGPSLGTASVPAEAWATVIHKGTPQSIRDTLVRSRNATFPFRRYLRRNSPSDVIETSVFVFPTAAAAKAWFAPFAAGVKQHPEGVLDAGATGSQSAFRLQLENYELQFVAGRYVADVFCWAPFVARATPDCEAATRALAETWFTSLTRKP